MFSLRPEVNAGLNYIRNSRILTMKLDDKINICVFTMEAVGAMPSELPDPDPEPGCPLVPGFLSWFSLLRCTDLTHCP